MMTDIWTVAQKELKEYLFQRGGSRTGGWALLVNLGVFGAYMPWMFGRDWLDSLYTIFWFLFVALFWTTNIIADSFAGERERHTLETLLASRLSNRAILLGKYLSTLIYVGGQMLIVLVLSVITINVAHGEPGQILWYRPSVALGAPGAGILGAGLVAGLGILISLRAPTVRQAQQTLLIPLTILLMLPSLGTMLLPDEQKTQLFRWFVQADIVAVLLGVLGVLALVDAALLAWAMSRFQRAKLILD